jgi:hypothetical protein
MEEGKHLGHIISERGIKIDPDRVEAIKQIGFPINKNEIQSFLGKVNFFPSGVTFQLDLKVESPRQNCKL